MISDPIQEPVMNPDTYAFQWKDASMRLTPVAKYQIVAEVMSLKKYRLGWQAQLAPVDMAFAWGRLLEPAAHQHIRYSQSNRWYFYRYSANCPYSRDYISSHSANHHLIPRTQNIRAALLQTRRGEIICLEGYLVNISGNVKGQNVWWNTSLSRTDSGNGACEVLLVTLVQKGPEIYQ